MNALTLYNYMDTYLIIGILLFVIGIYGMICRRTFIGMLISAELILSGASLNFMTFNHFLAPNPIVGQTFTLFIMAIAAAETAIILSIIIAVHRNFKSIRTDVVKDLQG